MISKYEIFTTDDGSDSIRIKDTEITFHSKTERYRNQSMCL